MKTFPVLFTVIVRMTKGKLKVICHIKVIFVKDVYVMITNI